MPYVVKGMDMSFSGLLSYCEDLVLNNETLKNELIHNRTQNKDSIMGQKILNRNSINKNIKDNNYTK